MVLSKGEIQGGSTNWAQGGVAAVTDPADSVEDHVRDTLVAGDGLCSERAVRFTIERGPDAVMELVNLGLDFDRDDGGYHLTQEGGHSFRRVLHVADATGYAIASTLSREALAQPSIELYANRIAIDIITTAKLGHHENRALGAYVYNTETKRVEVFEAPYVILATGGASKVYLYTSNPDGATGDGVAMAWRAGCRVSNMEFNQFHPTCLFHPHAKSFLVSEAVRGEGGKLLLPDGTRFMDRFDERAELAPRDIVARAIDHEMKRLGSDCVYLDISHRDEAFIDAHFPNIRAKCLEYGIDMVNDPIPVVPAAHYTCGGVVVDLNGATDVDGLYAVGETTCSGLHGANRLASNSLLECLVFGDAAARHILAAREAATPEAVEIRAWDESRVTDSDELVVLSHNWQELRRFMWDYVGIVRTNKRLERALRRVQLLKQEIHDYYANHRVTPDLIETRNLVHVADLIVRSALARRESRGLHFTIDYPNKAVHPSPSILYPEIDPLDVLQPESPVSRGESSARRS